MQRTYLWWSLCALYLHVFQVRITVGEYSEPRSISNLYQIHKSTFTSNDLWDGKKGHHVSHCISYATWLLKCSGQGVRLCPPEKKYPEAAAVVSIDKCDIRQCLAVRPIQQTVAPGTCFLSLTCKSPWLNYSIKLVF